MQKKDFFLKFLSKSLAFAFLFVVFSNSLYASIGIYDLHIKDSDYVKDENHVPSMKVNLLMSKIANMAYQDKLSDYDKLFLKDNGFDTANHSFFRYDGGSFTVFPPFKAPYTFKFHTVGLKLEKNIIVNGTNKKLIIISFRGTQTLADALIDLNGLKSQFYDYKNIKVHEGFNYYFETVRKNYDSTFIDLVNNKNNIFIFVGHSLGGAVAKLYAASLRERGMPRNSVFAYTFGAPPVSYSKDGFTKRYSSSGEVPVNIIETANKLDPVYHLAYMKQIVSSLDYLKPVDTYSFGFKDDGDSGSIYPGCDARGLIGVENFANNWFGNDNVQRDACEGYAHKLGLYIQNIYQNLDMTSILYNNIKNTPPPSDYKINFEEYQLDGINQLLKKYPYKDVVSGDTFDASKLSELDRKKLIQKLKYLNIGISFNSFGTYGEELRAVMKNITFSKKDIIALYKDKLDSSFEYELTDYSKLAWGSTLNFSALLTDFLTLGSSGVFTKIPQLQKFATSLEKFRKVNKALKGPLFKAVKISQSTPFVFVKTLLENGFIINDTMMETIKDDEAVAGMLNSIVGMQGELTKAALNSALKEHKSAIVIYFIGMANDIITNLLKGGLEAGLTDKSTVQAIDEVIKTLPGFIPIAGPLYNQWNLAQEISDDIDNKPKVKEAWANFLSINNLVIEEIQTLGNAMFENKLDIIMSQALVNIKKDYVKQLITEKLTEQNKPRLIFSIPRDTTLTGYTINSQIGEEITFYPSYGAKQLTSCIENANIKTFDNDGAYTTSNENLKWKLWYRTDSEDKSVELTRDGTSFSFDVPADKFSINDLTYSTEGKRDYRSCGIDMQWQTISNNSDNNSSSTTTVPKPLKKTGQTVSYTDFDDGYYQAGVNPNYTRDATKQIVTDHVTGLMWQDDSEAKDITKTYEDAKAYCSSLGLGGYTDWRLPSIKELQTIVDDGKYYPSIDSVFENITSYYYWSSTTSVDYSGYAWYVYFYGGYAYGYYKSNSYHVRCVSGGQ